MPASKFTLFRESALAAVAAIAACSAIASSALAHDTLTDLGGTVERGAVNAFTPNNTARPWVRKYFAPVNSKLCLEVSQVSPFADLEMVVVEPNPRVTVRDDDSGDQHRHREAVDARELVEPGRAVRENYVSGEQRRRSEHRDQERQRPRRSR